MTGVTGGLDGVTRGYSWLQEVTGDYKRLQGLNKRLRGITGNYKWLQLITRG